MATRYSEGTCEACGKHFVGLRSGQAPRRFCSTKCAYAGRSSGSEARAQTLAATIRECERCGAPFTPTSARQKYCPAGCKRQVDADRAVAKFMDRPLICAHCGKSYARVDGERKYCSVECRTAANAYKGNHALRGGKQSEEHIARRVASMQAKLAQTTRICIRCAASYTPTAAAQKYCSGQCWNAAAATRRDPVDRPVITQAEFERLLEKQNGLCGICHQPNGSGHRLAADHNHKTGAIRGLLCHRCNRALGYFQDDTMRLAAAITYLQEHS